MKRAFVSRVLAAAYAIGLTTGAAGASLNIRLDFENRVSLQTSPTLARQGDLISVSVLEPEQARQSGLTYPVKYEVDNLAGNRIAAVSARVHAPAVLHTRAWPEGGYRITAEIDPPGSGTIRLSRYVHVGDFRASVDRFIREAPIGFAPRTRPAMTLDYCVRRLDLLREQGSEALEKASDEVIEYFRWLPRFRAAGGADDAYRDWSGSLVGAYWSGIDESAQHYALYAPANYYRGEPIPVVVVLHGYDPANRPYAAGNRQVRPLARRLAEQHRCLVLEPFGRGNTFYRGIGRADVLRAIEEVRRDFDVDPDRIYLMGYSMGGSGTWAVGTFYADRFAAIAPVFGGPPYPLPLAPEDELPLNRRFGPFRVSPFLCADNLMNTPVFVNHGDADTLVPVDYSRQMALLLQRQGYDVRYWEHPGKGHGGLPIEAALFEWFGRYERPKAPAHVRLKAGWLRHGTMHWVRVDRFQHLRGPAGVDARIAPDNLVSIQSENVSVLTLSPPAELIDADRPLEVVWNGEAVEVERVADREWRMIDRGTPREALTAPLRKTAGFEGPIDDVYTSAFIVVQGSQAADPIMRAIVDAEARSVAEAWRQWQHVTPRVKLDADVTLEDMQSYNLIVIGGQDENFIANKILPELPLAVSRDTIEFFGQRYSGDDLGLAMLYPNPLAPDRCVLFLVGATPAGLAGLSARAIGSYDYFISDSRTIAREYDPRTMIAAGRFDQQWQVRPQYVTAGSEEARDAVPVGRRAPLYPTIANAPDTLYLSDLVPSRQVGAIREAGLDRTPYGAPLRLGTKRLFKDNVYAKGVASRVPHGLNRIEYDLGGQYGRFRAVVGLQLRPGEDLTDAERQNTRVIFTVTGDEKALWQSPPISWESQPVEVDVDLSGVGTLALSVANEVMWHYRADSANWCDARVER